MSDLTDFLLAQFAEDEAVAQDAMAPSGRWEAFENRDEPGSGEVTETGVNEFASERHDAVQGVTYTGYNRVVDRPRHREVVDTGTDPRDLAAWRYGPPVGPTGTEQMRHIARHDPARVLVECEAKRQIVMIAQGLLDGFDHKPGALWEDVNRRERHHARVILESLALPYADHPDYRPEW